MCHFLPMPFVIVRLTAEMNERRQCGQNRKLSHDATMLSSPHAIVKDRRKLSMNTDSTILCFGCSEEEIRAVKFGRPSENIEVVSTDLAADVIACPSFMVIIHPEEMTDDDLRMCAGYFRETEEVPILTARCSIFDEEQVRYRVLESRRFEQKIKYEILDYHNRNLHSEDFHRRMTEAFLIMKCILKEPGISTKQLSERIERSERTVLRYIHSLNCAGEWIEYDKKRNGWYLPDGKSLLADDAIRFTE